MSSPEYNDSNHSLICNTLVDTGCICNFNYKIHPIYLCLSTQRNKSFISYQINHRRLHSPRSHSLGRSVRSAAVGETTSRAVTTRRGCTCIHLSRARRINGSVNARVPILICRATEKTLKGSKAACRPRRSKYPRRAIFA